MKKYKVKIGNIEIEVIQDNDGKFIKPDIIKFYEQFGTSLKPAHEPIILARKPIEKGLSIAENCLKWGVGGLSIDESRVGNEKRFNPPAKSKKGTFNCSPDSGISYVGSYITGRFPANLIHDGSDEVKECFPETKGGNYKPPIARKRKGHKLVESYGTSNAPDNYGDEGSAARFFKSCPFTEEDFKSILYFAKASKKERNMGLEGMPKKAKTELNKIGGEKSDFKTGSGNPRDIYEANFHPTVKPLSLMKYLVNMITREGQIVLDPFIGSGTTALACKMLNRKFVGIEIMPEYVKIAKARLKAVQEPLL